MQQALEEAAQLAQRIHPPLLETGGLAAALRAAASSAGVTSSVEVAAGASYPPEVVTTVYLCWLEALQAPAGRVTIVVRDAEGGLSFEIGGSRPGDPNGYATASRRWAASSMSTSDTRLRLASLSRG